MKSTITKTIIGLCATTSLSTLFSLADATGIVSRPDSHAPIGVMADHTHKAGEWMVSTRYMYMDMGGHRDGTRSLSTQQVYGQGFDSAATSMEMEMQMLGIMYAPTDQLTLMAMTNYVSKSMTMEMNPMAGGHGAHGMGHGHGMMGGTHSHSSEGWGDTSVSALYNFYSDERKSAHVQLGLVLPTAKVDVKDGNTFQPYGMQLGGGTYDLLLGVTYQQQFDRISFGVQASTRIGLEDENESGFAYGDSYSATAWVARPVNEWLSLSARIAYQYQEDIKGHYNGPHSHSAPNHFQQNYGGHLAQVGVGANFYFQQGFFSGHRFAIEVLVPFIQDNNGVGMENDFTLTAGWQKAF